MQLPNCDNACVPLIHELDSAVLVRDLEAHSLKQGDVGVVVHVYQNGQGYEVEFVTGEGETVAVVTLSAGDIRPMGRKEILHVREFAPV